MTKYLLWFMRMKKDSKLWDVIIHLKDSLSDPQIKEELILLLRLAVSIISKLMDKETFEKRLTEVYRTILDYVYPEQTQSKSPADNVSAVD